MIEDVRLIDFSWVMQILDGIFGWYEAFIWGNLSGSWCYFLEYIYLFLVFCFLVTIPFFIRRLFR